MELRRFLPLLTIVLVIILAIVAWFLPPNEDFQAENPFWNGTKSLGSSLPASPLASLSDLATLPAGATLILIPYLEFTPPELGELDSFVSRGGTLVLADDYGFGNQVLEYLGLKARFAGELLIDPLYYYQKKWFPRISHLIPSPITNNIKSLVFNHATSLTGVDRSEVRALSSTVSFLDLDGLWWYNEGEPVGPLPVISQHHLGKGEIILISDPSIFINGMQGIEDNHTLLQNIADITTSEVFFDQSHLPTSNLNRTKTVMASIRNSLATPVGKVALVALVLSIMLIPIWHKKKDKAVPGEKNYRKAGNSLLH